MAIITTYTADSAPADDDKYLTSDASGATKLTSASTLRTYVLDASGYTGAVDLSGASSVKLPASSVTPANLGDSGLVQLTYASGYSSSSAYARKVGCVIYLQGFIKINSGTIPSSTTTVATLPAGMIDGIYRELPINYTSKATISSTGQLMLADKDAVQFIYVDGISFITT